jgi:hypothetical protein
MSIPSDVGKRDKDVKEKLPVRKNDRKTNGEESEKVDSLLCKSPVKKFGKVTGANRAREDEEVEDLFREGRKT